MAPHDYDATLRRFRDGRTGRAIPRERVRGLIDDLVATVQRDAGRLARAYERKTISLAEFEIGMRELLKSGHLIASAVGRGGRSRMTLADWGRVGAKLRDEYAYLANFSRKIAAGRISKLVTPQRAQLYAAGIRTSFYKAFAVEGRESPGTPDRPRVRRILNAEESCEGCEHYASLGWIDADEMPEIGELECMVFCKCDLEFEDDEVSIAERLGDVRVKLTVVTDDE